MMASATHEQIRVLCVDDNPHVADALKVKVGRTGGMQWAGWLANANDLVRVAEREHPTVVLLDLDMPGRDPFEALAELSQRCPETRAIVLSGYVRLDYIEKATEAGAWGYVSKNDDENEITDAIRRVAAGEFVWSPGVQREFGSP